METREVTREEAGRSCPYCRFPLKQGSQAASCPECGALHHTDCWEEGRCAVVGCAGGPGGAESALPPATKGTPVVVEPERAVRPEAPETAAPQPPGTGGSSNARYAVIGAFVALVAVIAALAGIIVLGGDDDSGGGSTSSPADSGQQAAPGTGSASDDGSNVQAQRRQLQNVKAANRISLLLKRSTEGRDASVDGYYEAALANRESILATLRTITRARGAVERARLKFIEAMEESVEANRAYLDDRDPSVYNQTATRLKQELADIWNGSVAYEFGLDPISSGAI